MLGDEEIPVIIKDLKLSRSANNKTYETADGREFTILGDPKPLEIEIKGQLSRTWPPSDMKKEDPEVTIRRLKYMMQSKMPQAFDIVGWNTDFSKIYSLHYVSVEGLRIIESSENGGDYDITLKLKEYKVIPAKRLIPLPGGGYEREEIWPEYVTEAQRVRMEEAKAYRLKWTSRLEGVSAEERRSDSQNRVYGIFITRIS